MFTITSKINQAIILASQLHFDKARKGTEKKSTGGILAEF